MLYQLQQQDILLQLEVEVQVVQEILNQQLEELQDQIQFLQAQLQ